MRPFRKSISDGLLFASAICRVSLFAGRPPSYGTNTPSSSTNPPRFQMWQMSTSRTGSYAQYCHQPIAPPLLRRLQGESIADKELSVLLAREQLVPVVHGTTYEALREISPLLASRNGLNTQENPMAVVAAKLAELVAL